jgi:hypothetical protein
MLDPQIILYWYMSNKTYSVLEFITNNKDKPLYVKAVLNGLTMYPLGPVVNVITEPPGTDYDIYRMLIGNAPQPVPELKYYPQNIQERFQTHDCWVGWAGIFDRKLTSSQRQMLSRYREAFLCLLVNGFEQEAYAIMKLAEQPVDVPGQLRGEIMYSKQVLREWLNLN